LTVDRCSRQVQSTGAVFSIHQEQRSAYSSSSVQWPTIDRSSVRRTTRAEQ
jgi:hypothetical protein